MRWPSSPGMGGFSSPGSRRFNFAQVTMRIMLMPPEIARTPRVADFV
jgi:hypothetical protein